MLGELYNPKGMALETARAVLEADNPHASNVALGCSNECSYCYGPLASRTSREKFKSVRCPKDTPLNLIRKQFKKGLTTEGVFLSFLTDPYLPNLRKDTEELVNYLMNWEDEHGQSIKTATLSKIGVSEYSHNMNGITLVSPYKKFTELFEPGVSSPQKRLELIDQTTEDMESIWVSMEPFPVQDIFPYDMREIKVFWEELAASCVDFIIFGKWNYDKRARTKKAQSEYAEIVPQFIDFCNDYGVRYHIKSDTMKLVRREE